MSDDLAADEIVEKIRTLRRRHTWWNVGLALAGLTAFGVPWLVAPEQGWLPYACAVGCAVAWTYLHGRFLKLACPRCGTTLSMSGRYSVGTLHRKQCARCGAAFE